MDGPGDDYISQVGGFPGALVVKTPPTIAEDTRASEGSTLGLESLG